MPLLSARILRFALAGAGIVVLLAVLWCGWQAWQVNRDLQSSVEHADAFEKAVENGDDASAQRELKALEESSAAAEDRTSGLTWSAVSRLPFVGDDADGVRTVSAVVHNLSTDGLEPLVEVQDRLPDLLPRNGAVPIRSIAALAQPVGEAQAALDRADRVLSAQDTSGYTGRLREKYDDLAGKVASAAQAMGSARTAVDLLPAMLGEDGDRNYLLVFQNNAEIRATGGLPGAVSLMHTHDGAIEISRQVAGADLGRASTPPLPLTDAEHQLYDAVLGSYFVSSNMTPDVPRAAALWTARWSQVYPDDHVDGVLTLDTVSLSYVLDATGPITVDGVELTGGNVVDQLLHDVYLRLHDPAAQDAFFADVTEAAFDRFLAGSDDPTGMIRALARATDESRVALHLADDDAQAEIDGTMIAGDFVTDPDDHRPQVDVTVNDSTAAKMSYYLRYDTDISTTYCTGGSVQGFAGKMRLTSTAPRDAASLPAYITGPARYTDPGNQWLTVRIYGPVGGSVDGLTVNAKSTKPIRVDQDGRPVAMFYVELRPGQVVDLAWTMKSGPGQTGEPQVRVTPSIVAGAPTPTPGAC